MASGFGNMRINCPVPAGVNAYVHALPSSNRVSVDISSGTSGSGYAVNTSQNIAVYFNWNSLDGGGSGSSSVVIPSGNSSGLSGPVSGVYSIDTVTITAISPASDSSNTYIIDNY